MIFVDTSVWFSMTVPSDQDHAAVAQLFRQNTEPLLTTDYVVDETLTLLRARGYTQRAVALGVEFFGGSLATLYYLTEGDVRATWNVFQKYQDKDWSFTDCASKVVMEQMKITQAASLDRHFRQFGQVIVRP